MKPVSSRESFPIDGLNSATLTAVLEAISGAAFVFERPEEILAANTLGRSLEDTDPVGVRRVLRRLLETGETDGYKVTTAESSGRIWYLAFRPIESPLIARSIMRARAWALSPAEQSVLISIVEGLSNAQIAARLGHSIKTIEARVTTLLRKSGHRRRRELLAFLLQ